MGCHNEPRWPFVVSRSVAFCCLFRPLNVAVWRFAFIGLTTMLILLAVDFQVEVPGRDRKIAAAQVVENIASVASKTKMDDLNGTKQWRLNWWRDILDYTVFGKHFWDGKGFGVNLADDDGYQVTKDGSLRSPHNGHLTMLARAGVPDSCCGSRFTLAGWLRSRSHL